MIIIRRNQISINITRFNSEVPEGYPEDRQIINVYSDSNNLFEALSKAYAKAINVIEEWQTVATRTDITTNADGTTSAKLLGRRYSENYQLEYVDSRIEMEKNLLFYIEHSDEILAVIKNSKNKASARENLEKQFGFTQQQISSILRVRFDMFTYEEVDDIKADIERCEKVIRERKERNKKE